MGATNTTANLELSQFVGSDKPDWLTDYNGDMLKIDGAYGAVSATAEEAAANAESAAASATQAAEDASEALAGISGAIDAAAAATAAAEQATSVSTSALTVANGAAATAQSASADAQQALQVANNAKVTAENAQAAAASAQQAATAAAADAATAQAAATQAATDAAASAAIASGVDTRVSAIEACVPAGASSSDKFALKSDLTDAPVWTMEIQNASVGWSAISNSMLPALNAISGLEFKNPRILAKSPEGTKVLNVVKIYKSGDPLEITAVNAVQLGIPAGSDCTNYTYGFTSNAATTKYVRVTNNGSTVINDNSIAPYSHLGGGSGTVTLEFYA